MVEIQTRQGRVLFKTMDLKLLDKLLVFLYTCSLILVSHSGALPFTASNPVVALYEYTNKVTELTSFTCTDGTNSNSPIVSLKSVSPTACASCFQVYPNCGAGPGNNYCLKYLPSQGSLNYDIANNYFATVTCTSGPDSNTTTVDIRLEPNSPPYFTSSSVVTYTLSSTASRGAGSSVYSTSCTDPDGDSLTYAMTSSPSSSLFAIGYTDGVIKATGDLQAACFSQITFSIMCQDPYNKAVGPITVQVRLDGANQQPSISGINTLTDVPEDTAVDTAIATFVVNDDGATTCTISANPTDALQYFKLGSGDNTIRVRNTLNYEQITTRNANLTVKCTDGYCTSNTAYLYVRITDVNEQNTLYPRDFTLSTYEGSISLDPLWTPLDEDQNDFPTYTILSGNTNNYFAINPTTGVITSTLKYDIDQSAMPTTQTIVVQAKDVAGHTSTATVTLTILDYNDNRPVFDQQNQQITISDCSSTIGSTIGFVTATDKDSSYQGNNVITYSGTTGPITVSATGNIIANSGITGGTTYTVTAQAKDAGEVPGPLSAAPASITVIVTICPTTTPAPTTVAPVTASVATTSTTTAKLTISAGTNSKNSLNENLGWIIIAALVGTAFLAALGLMIWKYCLPYFNAGRGSGFCNRLCGDCCESQPNKPRTVQPAKGQPPKNGNRGFWQERYPDDDYHDQPIRDRTPSPAPIEDGGPLALETWRPRAQRF